jgi:Domain of unknown function (DUF1918)
MTLKSGDRVIAESEQVGRPARSGVILEVMAGVKHARYRIRWDDGHESVYTPDAGALRAAQPKPT